jgi:hypothetical protein
MSRFAETMSRRRNLQGQHLERASTGCYRCKFWIYTVKPPHVETTPSLIWNHGYSRRVSGECSYHETYDYEESQRKAAVVSLLGSLISSDRAPELRAENVCEKVRLKARERRPKVTHGACQIVTYTVEENRRK